jgi:hypothetical protein
LTVCTDNCHSISSFALTFTSSICSLYWHSKALSLSCQIWSPLQTLERSFGVARWQALPLLAFVLQSSLF